MMSEGVHNTESTTEQHHVKIVEFHKKTEETNNNNQEETQDAENIEVKTSETGEVNVNGDLEGLKIKYSPSSFGYPKVLPTEKPPLPPKPKLPTPKPRLSLIETDKIKDDSPLKPPRKFAANRASVLDYSTNHQNLEIIRRTESQDSVNNIEKELSYFTMDKKKKSSSFKKLFTGGFFGNKDKKDERSKYSTNENLVYSENNLKNETNFNRNTPQRHTISHGVSPTNKQPPQSNESYNISPGLLQEIEKRYAEQHKNNFENVRRVFNEPKLDEPIIKDINVKPTISSYIKPEIQRYIDNSSSSTLESDRTTSYENSLVAQAELLKIRQNEEFRKLNGLERTSSFRSHNQRETPPRAQETSQNLRVITPKASIPLNSERALPNPYQNEIESNRLSSKESPKTIERNLNRNDSKKEYQIKTSVPYLEETYGTVFDSVDHQMRKNSAVRSPTPSLENTKLKLPPNRDITPLTPKVKTPTHNDRIIATELLRNSRPPTPTNKTSRQFSFRKNSMDSQNSITVTDATVHRSPLTVRHQSSEDILSPHNKNQSMHKRTSLVVRPSTPNNRPLSPTALSIRSNTPIDSRSSLYSPASPQKEDIRKSVEAYFWKEMKKLKEQKDREIMDHAQHQIVQHRSRNINQGSERGRRSLSLPRDAVMMDPYGRVYNPQIVQEIRPQEQIYGYVNQPQHFVYPPTTFIRSSPQRRTISSMGINNMDDIYNRNYRPLMMKKLQENKKVSFSENSEQSWPTRNGFTKSPPQRRIEKRDSALEDDVFLPENYSRGYNNEGIYGNRQQIYQQNLGRARLQTAQVPYRVTRHGSLQMDQSPYIQNFQKRIPDNISLRDEIIVDSQVIPVEKVIYNDNPGMHQQQHYLPRESYQNNPIYEGQNVQHKPPIYVQRQINDVNGIYGRKLYFNEPLYGSRRSIQMQEPRAIGNEPQYVQESPYGVKQISVRNKVCDIYGQIHDTDNVQTYGQQSGVLLGQLRQENPNFQRGTRLTSSANDMYKRLNSYGPEQGNNQPKYVVRPRLNREQVLQQYDNNFDPNSRPLPPIPPKSKRVILQQSNIAASDTESGSDASEIRKILPPKEPNNKSDKKSEKNKAKAEKPKKKGFFRRS